MLGVTRVGVTATAAMLDEAKQRLERGEDLAELASGNISAGRSIR